MNFRDVELLSSYLDGQTSPSDSARLESRLKTDPELAQALAALRESRGLLRQLPHRRAPRNFTLTRQMVGLKPPLPRTYPIFRFATALAAFLFVFSFATNQVGQLAASAPVPVYGFGGGGDAEPFAESSAATAAPAAEPTMEAALAPEATRETVPGINPPAANDSAQKSADNNNVPQTRARFSVPATWVSLFASIALLGALMLFAIPRLAARKWRAK